MFSVFMQGKNNGGKEKKLKAWDQVLYNTQYTTHFYTQVATWVVPAFHKLVQFNFSG